MNTEEALIFLEQHQPMPSDKNLTEDLINRYDDVRKYFIENRDVRCVPLFLNSFGFIDGFGVYQLIEDIIIQYESKEVVPHLEKALMSDHYSIRYWNAQIASNFTSEELILPLSKLLEEEDFDIKFACLVAIKNNDSLKKNIIVEKYLSSEKNPELLELAHEIIK